MTNANSVIHSSFDIRHLLTGSHMFHNLAHSLADNWPIWFVTLTLIVAAVIDGLQLKRPNWITFPLIISGWTYSAAPSPYPRWEGLLNSSAGTSLCLPPLPP